MMQMQKIFNFNLKSDGCIHVAKFTPAHLIARLCRYFDDGKIAMILDRATKDMYNEDDQLVIFYIKEENNYVVINTSREKYAGITRKETGVLTHAIVFCDKVYDKVVLGLRKSSYKFGQFVHLVKIKLVGEPKYPWER